jgi:hypothetical protein
MNPCPPGPIGSIGAVLNFLENLRANECLSPVDDTGDKLFSGVNDTVDDKCIAGVISCLGFSVIAGVVDTGDKFIASDNATGEQLSPVTMPPAINLLAVTRTRSPWRWELPKLSVVDTADKH